MTSQLRTIFLRLRESHRNEKVVIGELNEYHLIPTPVFSSFKPPSAQKRRKILKRSISYYFKKFFQLDNHKSCIISNVSQLEHYISLLYPICNVCT